VHVGRSFMDSILCRDGTHQLGAFRKRCYRFLSCGSI